MIRHLILACVCVAAASAAVDLDGSDDYVQIGDDASLQLGTGDFTVAGWFYADVVSYGTTAQGTLVSKNFTGLEIFLYQGKMNAYVGGTANTTDGTTTLSTGVWYHYALRRSGTTLTLWLNGGVEASVTNSASASNASTSLMLGRRPGSSTAWLNGQLAETAVWNVALADAEIISLARGRTPLGVRLGGLVSYVPLVRAGGSDTVSARTLTYFGGAGTATHVRSYR